MDPFESNSHSFIVKVWREQRHSLTSRTIWRGHITHVPGGERRYFNQLCDLPIAIAPYLAQLGVSLGIAWRFRVWLRQQMHRAKK